MENILHPQPKLLKSRIKVSRYFAVLCVAILLFCAPQSPMFEDITEWAGYLCLIVAVAGALPVPCMWAGGKTKRWSMTGHILWFAIHYMCSVFVGSLGLDLLLG